MIPDVASRHSLHLEIFVILSSTRLLVSRHSFKTMHRLLQRKARKISPVESRRRRPQLMWNETVDKLFLLTTTDRILQSLAVNTNRIRALFFKDPNNSTIFLIVYADTPVFKRSTYHPLPLFVDLSEPWEATEWIASLSHSSLNRTKGRTIVAVIFSASHDPSNVLQRVECDERITRNLQMREEDMVSCLAE